MEWVLIITAAIFYLTGYIMRKWPPKYRNAFYGYRTPASMRDEDAWDFAQEYSADLMRILGVGGFVLSIYYMITGADHETIGVVIGVYAILSTVLLIGLTEVALRKRDD